MIVLTGLKHAGKSTAAEALRHAFQYRMHSLDQSVAAVCGHATAADAYRAVGRRRFRRVEYALLRDQLCAIMMPNDGLPPCVLDCGGGVVSYTPTRRLLRKFAAAAHDSDGGRLALVYLQADPQLLIDRFADDRPAFLSADATRAQAQWKRIASRRVRQYAALDPITIATDELTPFIADPRALATALLTRIDELRQGDR